MKKITYLIFLSLFYSCSGSTPKKDALKSARFKFPEGRCDYSSDKQVRDKVVRAATGRNSGLIKCFENYMKFEKQKNQSFNVCHAISVNPQGRVGYISLSSLGKRIPKDFKMCLEQQFRVLNFRGLGLRNNNYLQFSIEYRSK